MTLIGTHKTSILSKNQMTKIIYHKTAVVSFDQETITLDTGGWRTATTKKRMNQAANAFNLGFNVFQKNMEWYVSFTNSKIIIPFTEDKITIKFNAKNEPILWDNE